MQASNPQRLAEDIHWLSGELLRRSGASSLALAEESELSPSQMKTLLVLAKQEGTLSVGQLAQALALSLPSASRAADALCQRELVQRCVCQADRRARELSLSPRGQALVERLNAARIADLRVFTDSLSSDERERLALALSGLHLREGSL